MNARLNYYRFRLHLNYNLFFKRSVEIGRSVVVEVQSWPQHIRKALKKFYRKGMAANSLKLFLIRLSIVLNLVLVSFLWYSNSSINPDQYWRLPSENLNLVTLDNPAQKHINERPEPVRSAVPVTEYIEPPRDVQEAAGVTDIPMSGAPIVLEADPPLDSLERKMYGDLRDCVTKPLKPYYSQHGNYWVLNNYIPAAMTFRCDESITYATHGDYTYLDNLDPLTSRWQGPVSVAVIAPGTDFGPTIDTILYLRNCMAEGIKKYVTFHLFFHVDHIPKEIPTTETLLMRKTSCDRDPPKWTNVSTYSQQKKLLYPVNIARNTARVNSQTYFVCVSDVELYPSINFIPDFMKMLKQPDFSNTTNPRVYAFPIFEVAETNAAPETKPQLQALLRNQTAVPFHQRICKECHNLPKGVEWRAAPPSSGLSVFTSTKRNIPFHHWEPIYVGTFKEPVYDERLSWEGKSDKMTQMYILCVHDYEFHVLDNAFLVHRPGIKPFTKDPQRDKIVGKQNHFIRKKIAPEYKALFGTRHGCTI